MLKKPTDIARLAAKRYERDWLSWLRGEGVWPLRIPLGVPGESDWSEGAAAVMEWLDSWKNVGGQAELAWERRTYRNKGENNFPVSISFTDAESLARWIGKESCWRDGIALRTRFLSEWPTASNPVDIHLAAMIGWESEELDRFMSTVNWIADHPHSGLYKRAIPVRGIHTKWFERHIDAVTDFIRCLVPELPQGNDLETLGLKGPPRLIRWRLLCPKLRDAIGGIDSLATSVEDLAEFRFLPKKVIVLENLETMLSLPRMVDCIAIFGHGYAFDGLALIPWLKDIQVCYWGDLDTHGFAILDMVREQIPHVTSLLMDRRTLMEFPDLWVVEPEQHGAHSFSRLSPEENSLFSDLRENRLGIGVRLEQERIPLDWAHEYLLRWLQGG